MDRIDHPPTTPHRVHQMQKHNATFSVIILPSQIKRRGRSPTLVYRRAALPAPDVASDDAAACDTCFTSAFASLSDTPMATRSVTAVSGVTLSSYRPTVEAINSQIKFGC